MAQRRAAVDFKALEVETQQRLVAQSELQRKADALEAINREQAEFTYAVSHELKSPTNTIRMLLDEFLIEDEEKT